MLLLRVEPDVSGIFLRRENRFVATVLLNGREERVHVHDPGRLEELLFEGNEVLLKKADSPRRKTGWDIIASRFGDMWVFTNSGYHRRISEILLRNLMKGYELRAEVKMGRSRIDFLASRGDEKVAIEVKGCTLARNGMALFPDAPTSRGRRHVEELIEFVRRGNRAMILFLIFRYDARCFSPNGETDAKFEEVFWRAMDEGVEVLPALLRYDPPDITYLGKIPVCSR